MADIYNKEATELFHKQLMNSVEELKKDTFKSHTSLADKLDKLNDSFVKSNDRFSRDIFDLQKYKATIDGQILLLKWAVGIATTIATGIILMLLQRII